MDTGEPLTVVFSFLSRADATPLDQRRRAEGHVLDHQGQVIPDPAADPSANAFEPDSNVNFEKWGEYWRKVHGVRFIQTEDVEDRSLEQLLYYDQIHRVAAGPTSLVSLPYCPPVDADGRLFPTIIGHVESYRRPKWDGVAYLGFAGLDNISVVLGTERIRTKILPEDRTIFRDLAPLLARQFIILPSEMGNDAIALVKTHLRRFDLDRSTFHKRWLHEHAALVMEQADTKRLVRRYVQLHNIGPTIEDEPFFHPETSRIDGVTLMAFATMKDVEAFLLSEGYGLIAAHERSLAREGGEYWSGLNFNIIDLLSPEKASTR